MKKFIALAVMIFLEFTGPDGNPVYVAPANVADVSASGEGYQTARTQIRTVNGSLYVRESPAEVVKRLRDVH
ncbi:MAG: hypothetical protein WA322_04780 [Pseudolabrys sp.]